MYNTIVIISEIILVLGRHVLLDMTCLLTWHVVYNLLSSGSAKRRMCVCVCVHTRVWKRERKCNCAKWLQFENMGDPLYYTYNCSIGLKFFKIKCWRKFCPSLRACVIQPLDTFIASSPLLTLLLSRLQPHWPHSVPSSLHQAFANTLPSA